jgi:hypothetical protein
MARIFRVETEECRHGLYDSGFSRVMTSDSTTRHPTPPNDGFKGNHDKVQQHHFGFGSIEQYRAWVNDDDISKLLAIRQHCWNCRQETTRLVLAEYKLKKRNIVRLGKQVMYKKKHSTHVADHELDWQPPQNP